jgi:antitoxin component HigA of HigAB toxin-antitoxin module
MNMQEIILTEEEYRRAIVRFLEICDAESGTSEYEEAILLSKLMEKYENMSFYERTKYN